MKKKGIVFLSFVLVLEAQNIDISKFYYRDYLDFGQGYGAFNGENSGKANTSNGTTLTGKDGTKVSVPNVPNFSASSNYGSLTSVGRGFAVTANHVSSPESIENLRKFGLTTYTIAKEKLVYENGVSVEINSISNPYGWDSKFLRFNKYIVEGQVDLLDIDNTTSQSDKGSDKETTNLNNFKAKLNELKDKDGNVYLYQAGSGDLILFGTSQSQGKIYLNSNGEMRGGGFGTLQNGSINYGDEVNCERDDKSECVRGISFNYKPNLDFRNIITEGDSGSGIYAYDSKNQKWILLGVTSKTFIQVGGDEGKVSFASNKDLQNYQNKFEQNINLKIQDPADANTWTLNGNKLKFEPRGDTPNESHILETNKDIIFRGGGTIKVQSDIDRMQNGYAGGFVFEAGNSASATNPTKYTFTNIGNYFFKGSGLDIGENVKVEWALRNQSGDSLHKIGKGELIITTKNTETTGLGTLKIGEGKVTLDTTTKAFENIYITSGRGELALKTGKAEALGAEKNTNSANSTTLATSYKLAQESTNNMGFYFGKGGGKFDLAGNSLVLNTIAANDSKAIITNSDIGEAVNLEIEGYGYTNNAKTDKKADTIIHASIGDNTSTNGTNLNLIYKGDKTAVNRHSERSEESISANLVDSSATLSPQNDSTASNTTQTTKALQGSGASLIFDGHINIQGALKATNANIVLQGHPTTHATISDGTIREQITKAESGTSAAMPNYMDLSKPSTLNQPDWDSRNFNIKKGINLTNATLTVGKAANLTADITADSTSQIYFGGKHFIDSKDGKNVIGSGFSYQQVVESSDLTNETYKDSSYSGKITANGTKITSQFFNFTPNLELSNNANLNAKYLTLTQSSTMNLINSTAEVENLIFQGFQNSDFSSKFKLESGSTFSVTQALSFDNSNLNLDTLKTTNNITLPTEYNLYAFNGSKITATNEFKNTKENAEFVLDGKSTTFTATSAVSFKSAELTLKNGAQFSANSLNFTENSIISLTDSGKLTLTGDLQTQSLNLNLSNSSTLNSKTLTSKGASTINLNDKAVLTLTDTFTSENLTLTLKNESKFTAQTLTASGVLNLNADEKSKITLTTLDLQKGNLQNISQNVDISTLKLTDSTANLELLNGQIPKTIDLKTQSNLYLKELNLNEFNTKGLNLTSDGTSQAHIKNLIYDAKNTKTAPNSNLAVSEKFELKNVGQNLGTTQGAQGTPNADDEKLQKDLFALEFSKNLELKDGTKLDISFADKVTKENLLFDKDYKIFSASTLIGSNLNINFTKSNGASFNETDFYATGKLDKENNAFFVQFVRENPRNFSKLNPHINPAYSPFLEILLQHNKFDKSIDKAVNLGDYSALQERLVNLDESFKHLANSSSNVLETLPLLQRRNINARIQSRRFASAKYAYNEERYNPLQKSDFMPTLLYLDQMEQEERVWSNAGGGYFTKDESKMSLQSVSVGYDKKLLGNEFLFGAMASITQTQLSHSADDFKQNPQIYSLAFYSNALLDGNELQNELGFSFFNDKRHIGDEELSAGGFGSFFNSLYKLKLSFLPQNFKPIILANANFNSLNAIDTPTYIQKSYKDLSFDVGLGFELDFEKEKGFYNVSFIAKQDVYHSEDEVLVSLARADKFISYKSNEPSLSYQLHLMGLENFNNGMFLRYSLSGFMDTKAYKGVSANIQLGYKY